jgi:hypothetical protein
VTARDKGERGKIVKKMRDILYGQPHKNKTNHSDILRLCIYRLEATIK